MYLLDFFSTIFSDLIEEPVLIIGLIAILLLFFVLPLSKLLLSYQETLSRSNLLIGISVCLVVILVISAVMIRIIYYPQGQYYNHGGPKGMVYLIVTTIVSLVAGLSAMSLYLKSSIRQKTVTQ
ncbi:hypothetical protein [Amphibacillus indicireducens]|uniref:Uncharacterized protein n=1 Tax=Amphibacillus indicireducens TaxID=1076330 RepID=A0ABP7VP06_9BACI